MLVTYSSNNSGGGWWLASKDWVALEKAGWTVEWGGTYFCHSEWNFNAPPAGKPEPCGEDADEKCPGHRKYDSLKECKAGGGYWLGAAAKSATKDFADPLEAVREFERVTGQSASDNGCNCCGPPHNFAWEGGYMSGDECLAAIFPGRKIPKNLREATEGA